MWLRLRGRRWARLSVEALLDKRAQMLARLDALEEVRAKFVTKARVKVAEKPSAHHVVEEMLQKAQGKFDQSGDILRHRLLLCDGALSARGIRPWEDEQSSSGRRDQDL